MPKKKRDRKTYDVPPEVSQIITDIAREYRVSESQIASCLLAKGLLDLDYSELARRLRESKSLYHNANVDIQDLLDRLKK